MSEIEAHNTILTDPAATARPATEPQPAPSSATPAAPQDVEDDIRGRAGIAPIKAEYLLQPSGTDSRDAHPLPSDAEADADDAAEGSTTERPAKRQRTDRNGGGGGDNKDKGDRKKNKGQNKNRPAPAARETGPKICRSWEMGTCERDTCRFQHSWAGYFETKSRDVVWPVEVLDAPPYVVYPYPEVKVDGEGGQEMAVGALERSLDLASRCPTFGELGFCPFGWRCRFLGGHVERVKRDEAEVEMGEKSGKGDDAVNEVDGWRLTCEVVRPEKEGWKVNETNWADTSLLSTLRSDRYDFPHTRKYLAAIEPDKPYTLSRRYKPPAPPVPEPTEELDEEAMMNAEAGPEEPGVIPGEAEAMDVPLRPEEKRRLNWQDGLYLAPLTTVGNLPFRRLCTQLGANITVSEMALAQPLINGHSEEWALCRRHASEKNFGIQLAGGFANRMVPAAEVIARELGAGDGSGKGVDFVDVNLGCPIDLVFNQGAGSALMDAPGRLGKILVGMNRALGEMKFRTGVANGKPNAHKLIPRFATEWGASCLTLHGRSRQQRYSKLANWNYIASCVSTLRASLADADLPPIPMFGNGDCYSAASYYAEKERTGVDGIMVARGALIKPWIFTEIAERREWDISATERLDLVRQYAEAGLSHWGSDKQGVSTTRRFLCEWLSFTHRYVPIGLLERLPAQMNERPPAYRGRSELETLLASPDSRDWVRISEMFLGKREEGWEWVPKHKSNAYGAEEAQG